MRYREINGWAEAVERARQLSPTIPAEAFERLAGEEAPTATYYDAPWFSLHPTAVTEAASKLATVPRRFFPHAMCEGCWNARHPETREPVRIEGFDPETCCWCGASTPAGLYVRADLAECPHCSCPKG